MVAWRRPSEEARESPLGGKCGPWRSARELRRPPVPPPPPGGNALTLRTWMAAGARVSSPQCHLCSPGRAEVANHGVKHEQQGLAGSEGHPVFHAFFTSLPQRTSGNVTAGTPAHPPGQQDETANNPDSVLATLGRKDFWVRPGQTSPSQGRPRHSRSSASAKLHHCR